MFMPFPKTRTPIQKKTHRVERSKVRVSFFQSSKPQSISPPESLHLYGGQSLIHFGNGGGGGGGGYDNNNSPLDTYITSTALNQQYDSLSSHQQQHFHPAHRDPNMAAVYGKTLRIKALWIWENSWISVDDIDRDGKVGTGRNSYTIHLDVFY
uniref:Uncharacterized protein n=1 Tax=Anopheles christyi TaxID=43041 RepID=A0A182KFA5_9DIPT